MIRILGGKVPAFSFDDSLEYSAQQQLIDVASHPMIAFSPLVMPDGHCGYGMSIGGVAAFDDSVLPYGVGNDIACGMSAMRLKLDKKALTIKNLIIAMRAVRKFIPMNFKKNDEHDNLDEAVDLLSRHASVSYNEPICNLHDVSVQLGTLGGGNHFLDVLYDENDMVWLMIHSGSRNLGKCICDKYYALAKEYCEKSGFDIQNKNLSHLSVDTHEGKSYIDAMHFCEDFSFLNRRIMMKKFLSAMSVGLNKKIEVDTSEFELINIHHNFARLENHYGKDVWVHRKGATYANKGEIGIVPGSMGTPSFIVRGLGNEESLCSCSHGAGRTMSRSMAKKTFTLDQFKAAMRGIVCSRIDMDHIDESPMAYKDIDLVMKSQSDLVEIVHRLLPLAVEIA